MRCKYFLTLQDVILSTDLHNRYGARGVDSYVRCVTIVENLREVVARTQMVATLN